LAIVLLEAGSTRCDVIDDVDKAWEVKTPPNGGLDCAGIRTANAIGVRGALPEGRAGNFDEPSFDPPGRKIAFRFVAHQSDSSE
jgi:hypothetical protein